MKFALKRPFNENLYSLMRKIGYHFQKEDKDYNPPTTSSHSFREWAPKKEFIFTRPPKGYPRFHIYLKIENENLIFNLHLDQKRPIYKGAPAHAGEYDSEVVEKEAERIKQILSNAKN